MTDSLRDMYDSVNDEAIPSWATMVAGYIDGNYQSYAGMVARFPSAIHVPIAVDPSTNGGLALDCENGDARPDQCPGWVRMRRAAGEPYPWIYCNEENAWDSVIAQFEAQGVAQPLYWVANYDGVRELPTRPGITCIAKQIENNAAADWDLSVVAAYVPGLDPKPVPPLPPLPIGDDMPFVLSHNNPPDSMLVDGGKGMHIIDTPDLAKLVAKFPQITVSDAQYALAVKTYGEVH